MPTLNYNAISRAFKPQIEAGHYFDPKTLRKLVFGEPAPFNRDFPKTRFQYPDDQREQWDDPEWLTNRGVAGRGADEARQICEVLNLPPREVRDPHSGRYGWQPGSRDLLDLQYIHAPAVSEAEAIAILKAALAFKRAVEMYGHDEFKRRWVIAAAQDQLLGRNGVMRTREWGQAFMARSADRGRAARVRPQMVFA